MYGLSQQNTSLSPGQQNYDDRDKYIPPPTVPVHQRPLVPDDDTGVSETKEKRSSHRRHHSHGHHKKSKKKEHHHHHHSSRNEQKKDESNAVMSKMEAKPPPLPPVGAITNDNKFPSNDGKKQVQAYTKYVHEKEMNPQFASIPNNKMPPNEGENSAACGMSTARMQPFIESECEKGINIHYYKEDHGQLSLPMMNKRKNEQGSLSRPGAVAVGPGGQEIDLESQLYVSNVSDNLDYQGSEVNCSIQQDAVEARFVTDDEVVRDHADEIAEMVQKKLMTNVVLPVDVNPSPPSEPDEDDTLSSRRKRRIYFTVVGLLLIVVAVTVGVAVALTRKDPDQEPTSTPLTIREQAFHSILEPVSGDFLLDATTPQHQALKWIANDDPANMTAGIDSSETITIRYVTALLFFAFRGHAWTKKFDFLSVGNVCTWMQNDLDSQVPFGIGCDSNLAIETLKLPMNNLIGSMPHEIGYLSSLTNVDMLNNTISGSLESLANLTSLEHLDLSENVLTGTLPEFFMAHDSLISLMLDNNRLEGAISPLLGSSSLLSIFWVRGNALTGTIPSAMGESSALESVDLMSNKLMGTIPGFVSNSILELWIANNELTGTIPTTIGSLANLQILHASANKLTGTIPTEFGNCQRLRFVVFDDNDLTGNIASVINSLPRSLESFEAYKNQLEGTIPTTIGLLSRIDFLDIPENKLSGVLPSEIGLLQRLSVLNVAHNVLSGTVPASIANLTELTTLRLEGNNFVGSLDAFCSIDLERFIANTCDNPDSIACTCCTHCCDDIYCNAI